MTYCAEGALLAPSFHTAGAVPQKRTAQYKKYLSHLAYNTHTHHLLGTGLRIGLPEHSPVRVTVLAPFAWHLRLCMHVDR